MALRLIQPAIACCVSLAEAKLHLRVDGTVEDTLISAYLMASQEAAESLMGRAIMPQQWLLTADRFQDGDSAYLRLRRPPVSKVESIDYVETEAGRITLPESAWRAYLANDLTAGVGPAFGTSWPVVRVEPDAVQIKFTCGYADTAAVPESIKAWIKLRLGTLYSTRESDVLERGADAHLGFVDFMLDAYKVWSM